MKIVTYFVDYWRTEHGKGEYRQCGNFTNKVEAIKFANSLYPWEKAKVRKHVETSEVIWRAKTLRGDTRARKAQ